MKKTLNGTCKFFDNEKKWGMITADCGLDAFVHWSDINKSGYKGLAKGERVRFDLERSPRGLRAKDVTPLVLEAV